MQEAETSQRKSKGPWVLLGLVAAALTVGTILLGGTRSTPPVAAGNASEPLAPTEVTVSGELRVAAPAEAPGMAKQEGLEIVSPTMGIYRIDPSAKGRELARHIGQFATVRGTLERREDGLDVLVVRSFRLLAS